MVTRGKLGSSGLLTVEHLLRLCLLSGFFAPCAPGTSSFLVQHLGTGALWAASHSQIRSFCHFLFLLILSPGLWALSTLSSPALGVALSGDCWVPSAAPADPRRTLPLYFQVKMIGLDSLSGFRSKV